jgi:hypothetical protein
MQSSVQTAQEYREMRTQSINGLDREMQVLEAHMPEAEAIVGRMNAIHNKIGEKNIASSREIRKPRANK